MARPEPSVADLAADALRAIDLPGRMERQPYQTMLIASGVGFVLAGGLFSRTTGRLLFAGAKLGLRVATLPVVQDQVLAAVQSALQPTPPPSP